MRGRKSVTSQQPHYLEARANKKISTSQADIATLMEEDEVEDEYECCEIRDTRALIFALKTIYEYADNEIVIFGLALHMAKLLTLL
jgi:hypothetical protein